MHVTEGNARYQRKAAEVKEIRWLSMSVAVSCLEALNNKCLLNGDKGEPIRGKKNRALKRRRCQCRSMSLHSKIAHHQGRFNQK